MTIQWNTDLPVEQIISIIGKRLSIDHSSFPMDLNIDIYALEISNLLKNETKLPEYDYFDILRKSLLVCDRNNQLNSKALLEQIKKNIDIYYALPEMNFIIRTTLSINKNAKIRPITIDDAQITFSVEEDRIFNKASENIINRFKKTYSALYPDNYHPVHIHVKNRTISGALSNGVDILDIFRGLCNLRLTLNTRFYSWEIKSEPINRVVVGPVYTIHMENGELADNELFSYQPDYSGGKDILLENSPDDLDRSILFTRKCIRLLKNHSYSKEIKKFLISYSRSLDSRDYHGSFLKISCLLEQMTGTRDSYKELISKRISFLYKDREYHKYIIGFLRNFRDSTVHKGLSTECYNEAYLYLLKQYVDKMLEFHLYNKNKFKNLQIATNYLNSPRTVDDLVIEEKYLRLVKKMYMSK